MIRKISGFANLVKKMQSIPDADYRLPGAVKRALDYHRWGKRGASFDDYILYGFYGKTTEERQKYILEDECVKTIPDLFNRKEDRHLLDNKADFNAFFHVFIGRDYLVATPDKADEFAEFCAGRESIIVKPLDEWCGKGIYRINLDSEKNTAEVLSSICRNGVMLVEEPIVQHEELARLNPDAVNTIRILSLTDAKGNISLPLAALRIGRKGYCVDNFHAHGMVAAIDTETGTVITKARDFESRLYQFHPDTGSRIEGFRIPEWETILETIRTAASMVPGLRYIGWDVTITSSGEPCIIEGNSNSGVDVFQTSLQKGVRDILVEGLGPFPIPK